MSRAARPVASIMLRVSAALLQHGEGSYAYVLDRKTIFTQQDIVGRRGAETIDADHIATT